MGGYGRAPKEPEQRRNHVAPLRGEWQVAPAGSWQHGEVPPAPAGLSDFARDAWGSWFRSWFAGHWGPEDLPGLRVVVLLYDAVVTGGQMRRTRELLLQLDAYGMTERGQRARRWLPPERPGSPSAA